MYHVIHNKRVPPNTQMQLTGASAFKGSPSFVRPPPSAYVHYYLAGELVAGS